MKHVIYIYTIIFNDLPFLIYIYIYIYIDHRHYHHSVWLARISLPSSVTHLYRPSLSAGLPCYILYLQRAIIDRFSLVAQPLLVCVRGSTGVPRLWACPHFSSTVLHVLFGWLLIKEVGGHTAAVFWDDASKTCSIQLAALEKIPTTWIKNEKWSNPKWRIWYENLLTL